MALNPSNSSNLEQLALKGLTLICQKIKTSRDLDHALLGQFVITEPVEKPPYSAVGKQGASHLYLGASNSLAPALHASEEDPTSIHIWFQGRRKKVMQNRHAFHGPAFSKENNIERRSCKIVQISSAFVSLKCSFILLIQLTSCRFSF